MRSTRFTVIFSGTVNEIGEYYDYDGNSNSNNNNHSDSRANGDDAASSSNSNMYNQHQSQQSSTERKPTSTSESSMLNVMRERRAANLFNENYVTDAQHNGKWINLLTILYIMCARMK